MNIPQPQTRPDLPTPPRRETLEALLLSDVEDIMADAVQSKIDQWKLPYFIEDGKLKDTLSQGEVYLRQFITCDSLTLQMKEDARLIAKTDYPVLIYGATGTGKELIAKSMIGDRKNEPIKAVNVAALPSELVESELFGSVKGSYTGSTQDKEGLFTSAKAGIMFLDEVGELALHLQAKLLRVLQDKTIRKVGSNKDEPISCKFVCATHRDLRDMVSKGLFREDLYARISTLELNIRPLRERLCDCVPIAESIPKGKKFLEKYAKELGAGGLDLSLNVRSIQRHIIRYDTLGKL
jgi:transcriptional regulator with PAS, ATPase and Fis domain